MKFFFFFLLGCFLFFSYCFSQETQSQEQQKEFDAKKNFFAVFLQLEGLGSILGSGLQYTTKNKQEFLIGGGVAERKQQAFGATTKIPLFQNFFLSGSIFQAENLKIPSTYTRGSEEANLFYSKTSLSGTILGGGYDWKLSPQNQLKFSLALGVIEQQFDGFLDKNFQTIQIESNLGDLNSALTNYGITYSFQQYPEKILPERGWRLYSKIANSTQTTNTLYSGTSKTDYALDLHIPLLKSLYLVPRFFQSTVKVVQLKLPDRTELEKHFEKLCSPDTGSDCNLLKEKLITNLSQHNKYGTATPLGGTDLIRSAPLFRYKGSLTKYSALEIRYPFYLGKTLLEPVIFIEQGRSYDPEVAEQDDSLLQANGVELRFHLSSELAYKILWASSEQNKAVQVNVDSTW